MHVQIRTGAIAHFYNDESTIFSNRPSNSDYVSNTHWIQIESVTARPLMWTVTMAATRRGRQGHGGLSSAIPPSIASFSLFSHSPAISQSARTNTYRLNPNHCNFATVAEPIAQQGSMFRFGRLSRRAMVIHGHPRVQYRSSSGLGQEVRG